MSDLENCETTEMKDIAEKYKNIMIAKGPKGLQEELNNNLDAWKNTKVKVAVVGNSGTGKSTFINAALGLDDENAAAVGIVETTMGIKEYTGEIKNVVFFDLPGVGTPNFPRETYAEKVDLERFDYIILIACDRFTENDIWLSKTIKEKGIKFCFARTHLEEDIDNDQNSRPETHDRQKVIDGIRKDCTENLKDVAPVDIYLIDSYACDQFDFDKLIKKLFQELKGMKAKILALSLTSATKEILDAKAMFLRVRLISVGIRVTLEYKKETADSLAREILSDESNFYKRVFGIDDETLSKDRDLFNLSQLRCDFKLQELEMIGKNMMETSGKVIDMFRKLFEKNNMFMGLPVDCLLFGEVIDLILNAMIIRYHRFASSIFQNIPIDFAEKCHAE